MNRLVRIVLMCVALLYPLRSLTAQDSGGLVASYDFHNYKLGEHSLDGKLLQALDSGIVKMKQNISIDSSTEIIVVGRADATPWNSCRNVENQKCSTLKNQTLAELRASSFARMLSRVYGINPSRIHSRGEVAEARGGEFRGVTAFIRRRSEVAPAQVALGPSPSLEVESLRNEVAKLGDSLGKLSKRITEIALAQTNQLPTETPTNIAIKTDTAQTEPLIHVDLGVGIAGVKTNHVDAFAPTLGIYIRPRASPVEFFLEGGYRPSSSSNKCNRADVVGSLGAHVPLRSFIGLSGGLFTAREMCTNGGPKLNERWLDRTNGVFFGPSLDFRFAGVPGSLNPALTWSSTYNAQRDKSVSGFGLQIRFNIRTGRN